MRGNLTRTRGAEVARSAARALALLAIVGLGLACLWAPLVFSAAPSLRWRLIPQPPRPAGAAQVEVQIPSIDVVRDTSFTTERPAAAMQQFYRAELPGQGWRYRCTVVDARPCGDLTLDPRSGYALIEVYERADARAGQGPGLWIYIGRPEGSTTAAGPQQVYMREALHDEHSYLWPMAAVGLAVGLALAGALRWPLPLARRPPKQ